MHVALGEAFGVEDADGGTGRPTWLPQLHRVTDGHIDTACVESVYQRLASADDLGMAIRVHGDLKLEKALRVRRSWMLFDFEGEPARLVAERRRPSSPLHVAGMTARFTDGHRRLATWNTPTRSAPARRYWAERNLNVPVRVRIGGRCAQASSPTSQRGALLGVQLDAAVTRSPTN
ncbi:MAG: hypothetical protein R2789_11695 [Microthrixaceae bacterium]